MPRNPQTVLQAWFRRECWRQITRHHAVGKFSFQWASVAGLSNCEVLSGWWRMVKSWGGMRLEILRNVSGPCRREWGKQDRVHEPARTSILASDDVTISYLRLCVDWTVEAP